MQPEAAHVSNSNDLLLVPLLITTPRKLVAALPRRSGASGADTPAAPRNERCIGGRPRPAATTAAAVAVVAATLAPCANQVKADLQSRSPPRATAPLPLAAAPGPGCGSPAPAGLQPRAAPAPQPPAPAAAGPSPTPSALLKSTGHPRASLAAWSSSLSRQDVHARADRDRLWVGKMVMPHLCTPAPRHCPGTSWRPGKARGRGRGEQGRTLQISMRFLYMNSKIAPLCISGKHHLGL